jgi:hypothetical protein
MMDRLSSFFLRRVRHLSRREIRRLAARNGLLILKHSIVSGHRVGHYVPVFDPSNLTGEADRDRQWVGDHLAAFLIEPPDASEQCALLVPPSILPAHLHGPVTPHKVNKAAQAYAVKTVGEAGEKPCIKTVATVLLLARAIQASGVELRVLVNLIRQPASIFALEVPIEGFERALMHLVEATEFLPFGPYAGLAADFNLGDDTWRWAWVAGEARRVFLKILVGEDLLLSRTGMRRELTRALAHGAPVLCVTENQQPIPDQVDLTCDVRLSGTGLDGNLLMGLLEAVYGGDIVSHHARTLAELDAPALTLADLSIAIRPGRPILSIIDALAGLAAHYREDQDSEKKRDEGAGARRFIAQSSVERARQTWDERNPDAPASKDNQKPKSKGKPTGSEVIQPAPGSDAAQRSPLTVEALTGYGSTKEWAIGLQADLTDYIAGDLAWSDMSTKLLLSGAPGTGKTTFARALCNSLQIPLVVTSVSTWLQGEYLHSVLDRMAGTFAEARALSPCILFIDEIDGIGMRVGALRQHAD